MLCLLAGGGWLMHPLFSNRVYAGVVLDGVDVSGKSRDEVAQILLRWQQEYHNRHIIAYYGDQTFPLDSKRVDFNIDVEATLNDTWNYGRQGSWWKRLQSIRLAAQNGYHVPLHIQYNKDKLDHVVETWKEAIDFPPKNAALSLLTGNIVPQQTGRKLATGQVRSILLQALQTPDSNRVLLPVVPLYPAITVADINKTGIKEALGTYTTEFNAQDANRTANLKLAAQKINGYMVYPGKTFSFNEVVGPREKAYGFKEAMEIVDNELVPGIGGGICQVSSTLYNAVLLADLGVVERHNHSKPLGYVPLGRDATVVFGALDFRFANTSKAPVMIMAEVLGNKLSIGVCGLKHLAETVEIVSADRQVIPPPIIKKGDKELYLGESEIEKQGKPGFKVTMFRIVRYKGKELRRELLSRDTYLPENTIVKVGTKIPLFIKEQK
ncbi:VanW family protein [Lucifera butyrica]|nr:VanW family protein [Lucifera butyrica]